MANLVSQKELKEFTGYKAPYKQSEWLCECRIVHQYPNGEGKVAVTWDQINNPREKVEEPNFEKVKQVAA